MNRIGIYSPTTFSSSNESKSVDENEELLQVKKLKTPIQKETKDIYDSQILDRPLSGLARLSPIKQYEYMKDYGSKKVPSATLKEIPGDPEGTIRRANSIINNATLLPVFENPDRALLNEALQLKRSVSRKLDKAA